MIELHTADRSDNVLINVYNVQCTNNYIYCILYVYRYMYIYENAIKKLQVKL